MTANPDVAPFVRLPGTRGPRDMRDAVMLGVRYGAGILLIGMAAALWVIPGSGLEADLVVPKLTLTCFLLIAGVSLMRTSIMSSHAEPLVQIDTIRRELRVLRAGAVDKTYTVETCAFAALSRVERAGANLRFFGPDTALLCEVTLGQRSTLNSVVSGLQDVGKL